MAKLVRHITAAILATASITLAAQVSQAQSFCNEREGIVKYLGKSHSEAPIAMGLVSNGSMLEVLASDKGSWTIIVTRPTGLACVVSAGEAWEAMAAKLPLEPGT